MNFVDDELRRNLWRPEFHAVFDHSSQLFRDSGSTARNWDRMAYAQYLDIQTYLPCDILTKVDVASMYHGLEVRTPLVDKCVVEFAATLPVEQRYRHQNSGKAIGKYITKKILGKKFPPDFIHRPKMGFGIPQAQWFLNGSSGLGLWDRVTLDEKSPLYELFDAGQVRALLDQSGANFNSNPLWLMLVLGLWLEQNPGVSFS
jgi:asparagine synthase (glutamine-hydrolysing)